MRPHFGRLPAFWRREGFTVAKNEYSVRVSFHCSPLALQRLNELAKERGVRSRDEFLRHVMEALFIREGTPMEIMAEIQKHHDLQGMSRPQRPLPGPGRRPLASFTRVERGMAEPDPNGEGQAPSAPSADIPPASCRPAG